MGTNELTNGSVIVALLKDEIQDTRKESLFKTKSLVGLTFVFIAVLAFFGLWVQWHIEEINNAHAQTLKDMSKTHQQVLSDSIIEFISQYECECEHIIINVEAF